MKKVLLTSAAALMVAGGAYAQEAYLVTGTGPNSTYKNGYAGPIVEALSPITEAELYGDVEDRNGNGTVGNLATCAAESFDLCFGIGQGNIVAGSQEVANGEVCVIRADLEPEYTFLFSNNDRLGDWGAIRRQWEAGRVVIYTSDTSSGSLGTLQAIAEATGFTNARVETLPSWDAVIQKVKSDPRAVGFTHRFADPSGFLNDLVDDHGMTVTGLAERALRRLTHANGEPIYSVNMEVPYDVYRVNTAVNTTPSMGSPVVLFGTCPSQYGSEAPFVEAVHAEIAGLDASEFDVDLGFWASLVNSAAAAGSAASEAGWDYFEELTQ